MFHDQTCKTFVARGLSGKGLRQKRSQQAEEASGWARSGWQNSKCKTITDDRHTQKRGWYTAQAAVPPRCAHSHVLYRSYICFPSTAQAAGARRRRACPQQVTCLGPSGHRHDRCILLARVVAAWAAQPASSDACISRSWAGLQWGLAGGRRERGHWQPKGNPTRDSHKQAPATSRSWRQAGLPSSSVCEGYPTPRRPAHLC